MLPAREGVGAPAAIGTLADGMKVRVRDYLQLTKARLSLTVVASGVVGYWLGASTIRSLAPPRVRRGNAPRRGGCERLQPGPGARVRRAHAPHRPASDSHGTDHTLGGGRRRRGSLRRRSSSSSSRRAAPLSGGLGLLGLVIYVLVYTPMKRRSSWSTLPGAISGALPTLMGFSAAARHALAARLVPLRAPVLLAVSAHLGHRRHVPRGLRARGTSRAPGARGRRRDHRRFGCTDPHESAAVAHGGCGRGLHRGYAGAGTGIHDLGGAFRKRTRAAPGPRLSWRRLCSTCRSCSPWPRSGEGGFEMPQTITEPAASRGSGGGIDVLEPGYGDYGKGGDAARRIETAKLGLWFGMGTITMLFAAFTSAYIVRSAGGDWVPLEAPTILWWNTAILLLSSVTMEISRRSFHRWQPHQLPQVAPGHGRPRSGVSRRPALRLA